MTLPTLSVILDDRGFLPRFASEFADVDRFGDLLRKRRSLAQSVAELATASELDAPLRLPDDLRAIEDLIQPTNTPRLFLILPSHLASTADIDAATLFLRKLSLLTEATSLWQGRTPSGAIVIDERELAAYLAVPFEHVERWRADRSASLPAIDDGLRLADLREPSSLLEYLSDSFSARHFNEVRQERWIVVKRSSDVAKMRREYRYYGLLPEHLQPYFVQPFGFEESGDGASYRMHRVLVPDLAVQWIHHAFSHEQFARLLEQLMRFIDERDVRAVTPAEGRAASELLYARKVEDRLATLLTMDVGRRAESVLATAGLDGGVASLVARYTALRAKLEGRRTFTELAITHGDLCFSNILFNPAGRSIHLIDPRGADTADELYGDPYYDLAKLSHSVLGGYDLIVAEQTRPVVGDDLAIHLAHDHTPDPRLGELFGAELERRGFDLLVVRLYEASLFLSMLPLHADVPTRVLALALRADEILTELERSA